MVDRVQPPPSLPGLLQGRGPIPGPQRVPPAHGFKAQINQGEEEPLLLGENRRRAGLGSYSSIAVKYLGLNG